MNRVESLLTRSMVPMGLLLIALAAGCRGGDPILGGGSLAANLQAAPTVTAVAPVNNATAVPVNNTVITASFSEPMAPITGTATFTVTAASPAVSPTGTVALDATNRIATFTLAPATTLANLTVYTATITGAKSLATGLPLASPYVWRFTTGIAVDATRPRVTLTVPATTIPGPTTAVPTNTAITATFTEDMAPASISAASFTVTTAAPGVSPAGSVSYAVGARTATFTPSTPTTLVAGTTYTATITTAATDLAGNALAGNQAALPAASNYIWTFTTAALVTPPPTITLTNPANLATNVAVNSSVNATFSKAMDPLTLTTATFTVQPTGPPLGSLVVGALTYNAVTQIATFTPTSPLAASTSYTATITGAKDLSGNALVAGLASNPWTFTTGTVAAPGGVALGSAGTFGIMATAAITNTGAGTLINGDVSLEPGTSNGLLPVQVNGTIHINDTVSHQARIDLLVAYNFAKNLPPGTTISAGADLAAVYPLGVPPGTYTSGSTILVSTPLILDAGGNANAVWVFQIGSSLTTTASVSLANGAQAKNVFWVPTLDATVGVGTIFYGTIVSGRDVTAKTGSVINGRILAGATLAGTIALDTNTVNVPAP
ncbi:Ig-like domain-containing protein [Geothrix sp.]|uniref:Ig-like domain-containing protein n=1 Tax=Geothrix sp. TaxID=1962974 RepID=UPI0025BF2481|nr:Ig-like domain-containing protein [Geothrix sp.]